MSVFYGSRHGWHGTARVMLSVVSAVIFSTLLLVGCGKDDNPAGGGGSLVCADGEAWTYTETEVEGGEVYTYTIGYVFKSNGDLLEVYKDDDGSWYGHTVGEWSTSGNKIIVTDSDGDVDDSMTYNISGNTLTLSMKNGPTTMSITLKRTSGIRNIKMYDDEDDYYYLQKQGKGGKLPNGIFGKK